MAGANRSDTRLALGLLLLATILIRLSSLWEPLGPDQAIYLTFGREILEGAVPYVEVWDHKPPMVYYLYAGVMSVFGRSMAIAPAIDLLLALFVVAVVYRTVHRVRDSETAFVAALLVSLFLNCRALSADSNGNASFGFYWYKGQADMLMNAWLTLFFCAFFVYLRDRKPLQGLWMGMALGAAFLTKLFPIVLLLLPAIHLVRQGRGANGRPAPEIRRTGLLLLAGLAAIVAPILGHLLAMGSLPEACRSIFLYGADYASVDEGGWLANWIIGAKFMKHLFRDTLPLIPFMFIGLVSLLRRLKTEDGLWVLWLLFAFAMTVIQRKYLGVHFASYVTPLAIIAAFGLGAFRDWMSRLPAFNPVRATAIVTLLVAMAFVNLETRLLTPRLHWLRYLTGAIDQDTFYMAYSQSPSHMYSFYADFLACRVIAETTKPGDQVACFGGHETVVFPLTGRRPATPFLYTWHMGYRRLQASPYIREYTQQYLDGLRANRPPCILVNRQKLRDEAFDFTAMHDAILELYEPAESFPEDRWIYRLRQESPAS